MSLNQNYTYDPVERLSSATETGSWSQSYGYTNGNRYVSANAGFSLSASTPTAASNFNTANRLNIINNVAYDNGVANGNGNQTAIGGYTYSYDAENRMVSAALSAGSTLLSSAAYVYDGLGQRVQKMTCNTSNPCTASAPDATVTTYVYDAFGNLAQEYSPSWSVIAWCGTPTCYLTQDQLGSTRMVTDANGLVDTRYDYLPFGEELPAGTGGRTPGMGYAYSENGFNPKFGGQMRDLESARDYLHFRYYSPQEGRFVSVDPGNAGADASDPQTWNGYAYVGNNPVNVTDPNGLGFFGDLFGLFGSFFGNAIFPGLGSLIGWGVGSLADLSTGQSVSPPGIGIGGAIFGGIVGSVNSGQPWNEQWSIGGGGSLNTGTVFGSGNTGPFIFSYQAGTYDADVFSNWGPSLTGLGTVYRIPGLVFKAEGTARANTIPFPLIVGGARIATWAGRLSGIGTVVGLLLMQKGDVSRPRSQAGQESDISWAAEQYRRQCGKTLDRPQRRRLHDAITGQGYSREELLEIMIQLFGCPAQGR